MIQIFMLNRGDDFTRFKRGEPIVVGPGVIVQLESRLSAKAYVASPSKNGAAPAKSKPKARRQFTDAEKKAVLAEMKRTGLSYYKMARKRGISPSVVMRWTQEAGLTTKATKV